MFYKILNKIRLLSKKRQEPYSYFYHITGFCPRQIDLYTLAVRHKSNPIIAPDKQTLSNERLEFLGDTVLNTIVSDYLFLKYPDKQEGFLTNTRSKIVKRESLNKLAIEIGLKKRVISLLNGSSENIYGNALEALIGAVYLDLGYDKCKKFVETRLIGRIDLKEIVNRELNFKSKLIEYCQKKQLQLEFKLLDEFSDKNSNHLFTTGLFIDGNLICEEWGKSKKSSEQNVSRKGFEILKGISTEEEEPEYQKQTVR